MLHFSSVAIAFRNINSVNPLLEVKSCQSDSPWSGVGFVQTLTLRRGGRTFTCTARGGSSPFDCSQLLITGGERRRLYPRWDVICMCSLLSSEQKSGLRGNPSRIGKICVHMWIWSGYFLDNACFIKQSYTINVHLDFAVWDYHVIKSTFSYFWFWWWFSLLKKYWIPQRPTFPLIC